MTVVIGSRYQIAFGQQGIQHIHHRVNGAAGVVAHIKDQRLDAIAGELLEGGIELGRSIVVELLDLDVAHIAVLFPGDHGHFDIPADDLHIIVLAVPADHQVQGGAFLAAHGGAQFRIVIGSDHSAFHFHDEVAHFNAGFLCRGIGKDLDDLHITAGVHDNADADGGLLALIGFHLCLIFLGGHIPGILVAQAADIALGYGIHQFFLINIPIKVLTDISVDLIEFAVHDFTFPQALHPAVEVVHGVACRNDNGYCRCQGHQRNGDAQ